MSDDSLILIRFRQLILAAIALLVGYEIFAWFWWPADVLEGELLAVDGFNAIFESNTVYYYLLFAVRLLVLIGLLTFHRLARSLFLYLTAFSLVASVTYGYRVTAPIEAPIFYLEAAVTGAILVLAYFTPVSAEFRKESSD